MFLVLHFSGGLFQKARPPDTLVEATEWRCYIDSLRYVITCIEAACFMLISFIIFFLFCIVLLQSLQKVFSSIPIIYIIQMGFVIFLLPSCRHEAINKEWG